MGLCATRSQRGHGSEWQVCLAHLLHDARYAIECGDTAFSVAFKRLLLRAIAIGRRLAKYRATRLRAASLLEHSWAPLLRSAWWPRGSSCDRPAVGWSKARQFPAA
jgi:hypothetical protein